MKIEEIPQTHTMILQKLDELQEIQNQTHANYKEYIEKNEDMDHNLHHEYINKTLNL